MNQDIHSKQVGRQTLYISIGLVFIGIFFALSLFGPIGRYANNPTRVFITLGIPSLCVAAIIAWMVLRDTKAEQEAVPTSINEEFTKNSFILDAMTDSVVVLNEKNVIIAFNKAASTLTDWPADEAKGLDYRSVIQFADVKGNSSEQQDVMGESLRQGKSLNTRINLVSRSKKNILINLYVSPILDNKGTFTGALIVMRDITIETQIQQQKADFVSTASHEMRTPVAAIEGYLALAMNDKVSTIDDRAREFLKKAHAGTESLGKLFRDLLTSEKADDGRLTNHPTTINMASFLETTIEGVKFLAEIKALDVELLIGTAKVIDTKNPLRKSLPPLYYVYADPNRLTEVISNLFDNAVKYTVKGKITVGLTADEQNIQFYVRDTGIGIAKEDLPHLFQKFYRVDTSTTQVISGTGLGLFIAKKIVEVCKGKMWVESELGKGTTFFVNLPRLSQQRVEELQKQSPKEPSRVTESKSTS